MIAMIVIGALAAYLIAVALIMAMFHVGACADQRCAWCGEKQIRAVLDDEPLCQQCCNKWARSQDPYNEDGFHG